MNKITTNKIAVTGIFALIIGLLFTGQASACCVYNHTSITVKTHLDCSDGWLPTCYNNWDIAPGDHKCRAGKGGGVDVCKTFNVIHANCYFAVDDHGWLSMYEETTRYKLVNYNDDGSVSDKVYIEK